MVFKATGLMNHKKVMKIEGKRESGTGSGTLISNELWKGKEKRMWRRSEWKIMCCPGIQEKEASQGNAMMRYFQYSNALS